MKFVDKIKFVDGRYSFFFFADAFFNVGGGKSLIELHDKHRPIDKLEP